MSEEKISVLSLVNFSDEILDRLRSISPRLQLRQHTFRRDDSFSNLPLEDVEVLYGSAGDLPVVRMPNLRWIQLHFAGIDGIDKEPLIERGIQVTTASGLHATPIAEYVLASILAWANHFPAMMEYQQRAEWPQNRSDHLRSRELRGRTVGILGYGSIGREAARLCNCFGMRVLAMRKDSSSRQDTGFTFPGTGDPEGRLPARWYTPDQRQEMLAECDYVVVTLPLTPETHHFIDAEELRAMPSRAYLVNIGRGAVIDEAALFEALREKRIAGAGLDVFQQEPLPADSLLWQLDNVILTPHVSGMTDRYDERACELFIENLRRYVHGEPLLNLVEWQRGY